MAETYSVGNIEIGIKTSNLKALEGIDKTISKLQDFKKIDHELQNIFLRINQMSNGFSKLSKININPLNQKITEISKSAEQFVASLSTMQQTNFTESANSLNKLANAFRQLDKLKNIDFKDLYMSFYRINRILEPFLQKLKESEASLVAMASVLNNLKFHVISKASKELDAIRRNTNKIADKSKEVDFNKMFNIGKIYFFINYSKRIVQAFGKIISSAIDFNETLNKFQVSMGNYYEQSLNFVNSITKAFNLSTESIMNYQSTFKNMLSALGNLSDETSYQLSESLTRMALDYASLFNVEVNRAMEQFQAVLSGQIRSIRSVSGYDVSETSIFNIYKDLGGTKTMRQLDQIEKRLLRIIAIQQQMEATGAVGDFEKTINTTANQLKQLSETFKELSRWIGQYLMFAIKPLIEKTLGFVVALKELFKYLNVAKGYKYEDFGSGGLFGEIEDSATNAEEAIDSVNNKLLGFDTLNILSDATSSTATQADYQKLIDKIKEYESGFDDVENKANDISKRILEWAGFTYDANGELKNTSNTLGTILGALAGIGVTFASVTFLPKITKLFTAIKGMGAISLFSGLPKTLGIISIILGIFTLLYTTNEDFRDSINGLIKSIGDLLLPIIKIIFGIIEALMPIINTIISEIAYILAPVISAISPIISAIGSLVEAMLPIIVTIVDIVANVLNVALSTVLTIFNGIWGVIEIIIQLLSGSLQIAIGGVTATVELLKGVFLTIVEFVKAIVVGFAEFLTTGKLDAFGKAFSNMATNMGKIWRNVWDSIKGVFVGIINGIIKGFATFVNAFTNVINGLTSSLSSIWEFVGIPAIPEIPRWNPNPIALASGGVINKPTHALVGEYAGANTNPEIVTPENLMREVFLDSMLPVVQAVVNGNKEVVDAIEELAKRPVELNGRKISENIYSSLEEVAIRKGKKLAL